ncbi:MAG: hypothetical protein HYX63_00305 [Gammaproteobacteria bacterium]|nr:hypothetical protein [Gammaproteobacteria bacterium]
MTQKVMSEGWRDLVDELKDLEAFFPVLGVGGEQAELQEEVEELRELIAAAGIPDDEHSVRALLYLQAELSKKLSLLNRLN